MGERSEKTSWRWAGGYRLLKSSLVDGERLEKLDQMSGLGEAKVVVGVKPAMKQSSVGGQ